MGWYQPTIRTVWSLSVQSVPLEPARLPHHSFFSPVAVDTGSYSNQQKKEKKNIIYHVFNELLCISVHFKSESIMSYPMICLHSPTPTSNMDHEKK
jgi:hypothetical protein